jgi:ribosomal protein L11 methyltransferase
MAQPVWRRLSIEARAADAEPARALLSDVSGVPIALEQREASRFVTASAFVRDGARAVALFETMRRRLKALQSQSILRGASLSHARVAERDWAAEMKRHYRPQRLAAGMWVAPSWARDFRPPGDADVLWLDPGMAFGTGRHATTAAAAELLLRRIAPRDVVIDAGCGSGILGLAATQRGAHAYAFDEDPVAVSVAKDNFTYNALRVRALVRADKVPNAFPRAAFIVANITAEVLQKMARAFAAKLARGGYLISAGITARGRLATLAALAQAGLDFVSERRSGLWFAYEHRKP